MGLLLTLLNYAVHDSNSSKFNVEILFPQMTVVEWTQRRWKRFTYLKSSCAHLLQKMQLQMARILSQNISH